MSKRNLENLNASRRRESDPRRTIVIVITLVIVAVAITGVTSLVIRADNGDQRNVSQPPRYMDVWAIYPDDTVRFMSLFHPVEGTESDTVQAAGPLMPSATAVLESVAIGGSIINDQLFEGPAHNADQFYVLYDIERDGSGDPYGLNILTDESPYVNPSTGLNANEREVALGTIQNSYYNQVIVAVAFPAGTDILGTSDLQPYRTSRVRGWDVYYFDVTDSSGERAIRISYVPLENESYPEPDMERIDRRR